MRINLTLCLTLLLLLQSSEKDLTETTVTVITIITKIYRITVSSSIPLVAITHMAIAENGNTTIPINSNLNNILPTMDHLEHKAVA